MALATPEVSTDLTERGLALFVVIRPRHKARETSFGLEFGLCSDVGQQKLNGPDSVTQSQ